MGSYNVWYLGGYLKPGVERQRYNDFGKGLAYVFHTLASVNSKFKDRYTFDWIERCTKGTFLEKWKSSKTAGIIFHSHGDSFDPRPVPLAYHHFVEGAKENRMEILGPRKDGVSRLRLDPKELPASSPSLRVLALLACHSRELHDDWISKIPGEPDRCRLIDVAGGLKGGDDWGPKEAEGINAWIWSKSKESMDFGWARESWKKYQQWAKNETCTFKRDPLRTDGDRSAWEFFKYLAYKGPAGNLQDKACALTPSNGAGGRHVLATGQAWVPGPSVRKSGPLGSA